MLTINISKFNEISLEDTLNYTVHSQKLEGTIATITRYSLKCLNEKKDSQDLSEDEIIMFYLTKCLLSISSNPVWIQNSNKHELDEVYLYVVLKKYFYNYTNKFDI